MSRFSTPFGAFEIDSMPGQPQIAICHAFVVPKDKRGQGYGHHLKAQQEVELDILHYDFALCSVAAGNKRQKAVLQKAGWRFLANFENNRQSEITEVWARGAIAIGEAACES